jgi:uncharacterized membrane protein YphA (DoxX/SURF4 family)
MNVALWVVAWVLAAAFVAAGLLKLTQSKAGLQQAGQAWTEEFPSAAIKGIGVLEIAGAVGLILPALTDTAQVLVPLAAVGLGLLMVGAAITHARRGETPMMMSNLVLLAMAVFVAWGRFGPYSF